MKTKFTILAILAVFALSLSISAQTTTFTYQGRLNDSATAANGTYDLNFALFDAQAGGTQIGTTQTRPAVSVSNGIFTVELDFGATAFPGNRYLEIAVKRPADAGFTTLTPRQQITSSPYSIRSLSAAIGGQCRTTRRNKCVGIRADDRCAFIGFENADCGK